jgi:acyl-CoA synthetase (AMP-forming)/AMP-acid ligase II
MDILVRSLRRCLSGAQVHALAVQQSGRQYTFEQLLYGADFLRTGIRKSVRPTIDSQYGPRIACLADPGPSYVLSMWCTWMSQGIFVPLATSHPPAVLEHSIVDSGASLVRY